MHFTATLKAPRFDWGRYEKRTHEYLADKLAQAAFLWIRAVLERIPVWSGASHATFLALARELGYVLIINPKSTAPVRVSWGASEGSAEIVADFKKGRYTFTYHTSLFYLIVNEYHDANAEYGFQLHQPGPYGFQNLGRKAFLEHARGVRLFNPFDSLRITTYRVS